MEQTATTTTLDDDIQKEKNTIHFVFISRRRLAVDEVYYIMWMINGQSTIDVGYKYLFLYYENLLKSDTVTRTESNAVSGTDLH